MIYLGKNPVGLNYIKKIDWDMVASGTSSQILDNIILSNSVTKIATKAFQTYPLKSIKGNGVTEIGAYGFYSDSKLETIDFPNLQIIKEHGLQGSGVKYITAPYLNHLGMDSLYSTSKLTCLDIGNKSIEEFSGERYAFEQNASCITIFRYNFVIQAAANWFYSNCWMKNSNTPGILYVWSNLIEDYQNHEVWGNLLSTNNNQILPIQGSIYETQYGDGTPIT